MAQVLPGGPAAQAGLQPGDIITEFNGYAIPDPDALLSRLVRMQPGETARLTVLRQGSTVTLAVAVGEAPPVQ